MPNIFRGQATKGSPVSIVTFGARRGATVPSHEVEVRLRGGGEAGGRGKERKEGGRQRQRGRGGRGRRREEMKEVVEEWGSYFIRP
jgi:hypothetical protein